LTTFHAEIEYIVMHDWNIFEHELNRVHGGEALNETFVP
jgi:hypothetical protein